MQKECTSCNVVKDVTDFRKDAARLDGYQSSCKLCVRDRIKVAYDTKYKKTASQRVKDRMTANRQVVAELKRNAGCAYCDETEPVCLEYHHRDPSVKEFGISNNTGMSLDKIKEEISKCVCVCSNCHKKIHAGIIILR